MFFRLFKSNQFIITFFVPLLAVLLSINHFNEPKTLVDGTPNMPLYQLIDYILLKINSSIGEHILISFFIIIQSFLISNIAARYKLLTTRTFLPAFIYIMVIASISSSEIALQIIFAGFFVFFGVDKLFSSEKKELIFSHLFDAALLISIASLFYFRVIAFFLLIWLSLVIMRPFKWREWVIPIIGLIVPYIFVIWGYFHFSHISVFLNTLAYNFRGTDFQILTPISYLYVMQFAVLFLFTLLGIYRILKMYNRLSINSRMFYTILFWMFAVCGLVFSLCGFKCVEIFYFASISVTFLLSNYFLTLKRNWQAELFFIIILATIFYEHYGYLIWI